MKYRIIIFCFLITIIACKDNKYKPTDLKKLSDSEIIEKAKRKDFPDIKTVIYKTEQGKVISIEKLQKENYSDEKWAADWYADKNGIVKEFILRKATENDKILKRRIQRAIEENPIEIVEFNCDKKSEILEEIYALDQNMRLSDNQKKYDPEIDRQNLIKVINLIEKCGMPTTKEISKKQMNAIWLVFQHADNTNRKKYFPLLKKSAENGDLSKSSIALMEDRILMIDGKPQIYGSQISENRETKKWELYKLEKPETVDKRRAEVGLGTLKEYVKKWNIEFNIKQFE
jgi:hypothetical protein